MTDQKTVERLAQEIACERYDNAPETPKHARGSDWRAWLGEARVILETRKAA